MIRNLTEAVGEIVKSTLASHVSNNAELLYAVETYLETHLQIFEETGPTILQDQRIGIWLILEEFDRRFTTRWSCSIEDYSEDILREGLVKVWDALVVQSMEENLKQS